MPTFTLALAQMATRLGDVRANLEKHLELAAEARARGASLVVFPELSLTGYMLQDLARGVAIRPTPGDPILHPLLEASRAADLVVGFVEADESERLYISSAYLSGGEIVHLHRKVYLPTYGLFQDGRFFGEGQAVRSFPTRFGRFGLLVCEDFWHISLPYLLWLDGAELMLFVSASPGRGLNSEGSLDSARWVEDVGEAYARLFTCYIAQTNRVGLEDGLTYWGGASVYAPDGRRLAQGPYFEEALTLAEIDLNQVRQIRSRLPLLRDERPDLLLRELERLRGNPQP
ncbi:MAG TPA: nitrilase-related carbon-nitrogen hydrolase [Anaerolineales bacterium]|nr:nitrilase-related carbon-nitrogen hydrolase [Anaerolineales bacterium]